MSTLFLRGFLRRFSTTILDNEILLVRNHKRRNLLGNLERRSFFVNPMNFYRKNNEENIQKSILHSDFDDLEIPNLSIEEFVFQNIHKWADHIALECPITGRQITYQELQDSYIRLNRNLRKKLKLAKGDVVAIMLPNCPEFAISLFGSLKAGLVVTTINPAYTPGEISYQLKDAQPRALFTLAELYPTVEKALELSHLQIPTITIRRHKNTTAIVQNTIDLDQFLNEKSDITDIEPPLPQVTAIMPYSSGTTGLPKGVELTHHNIVSNVCQFDSIKLCKPTNGSYQDSIPAVLPKFHIYGLVANIFYLHWIGCKVLDLPKFDPELYLKVLKEHKVPVLFVAPPIVLFLSGNPAVEQAHLNSLRTVISGAAPLGALDEVKFLQKVGRDIDMLQGYGLTETSPVVSTTSHALCSIPTSTGSIGRPLPNTAVQIVNFEENRPLGPNEKGEILVSGPQVMRGYFNRPEETKASFTPDGQWFRTGDLGYYNNDRLLFITDRLKELIKVKGYQVAPAELEEVIRAYPDVADVGVVGVPHEYLGEAPRAFIVPKKGTTINTEKLNEFLATKLTSYKQLKGGIEICDAIPKNAAGKILRRKLREKYDKK